MKKNDGVVIPTISPVRADGKIDTNSVKKTMRYLFNAGVSVFIQGTTGEALSLSNSERIRFVEAAAEVDKKGNMLYAGISHNSFSDAVKLATHYFERGIDVAVAHLPPFYPLSNEQIQTYFERLADAIPGPLIIYNIPQTVHTSVPIGVVKKLSLHPNIWGIKDSEPDVARLQELIKFSNTQEKFCHLTGWAAQSSYALSLGSDGIVPSAGNVIPQIYKQLYDASICKDYEKVEVLQKQTNTFSQIYQKNRSLSGSLAALKVMMAHIGLCQPHMLSPLLDCSADEKEKIIKDMNANKQLNHTI